jgi:hypothetical protein
VAELTFLAADEGLISFLGGMRDGFIAAEERAMFGGEGSEFLDMGRLFVRYRDVSCESALTACAAIPTV